MCRCVGIPRGAQLDDGCVGSVGGVFDVGACEIVSAALMLGSSPGDTVSYRIIGVSFCFPCAEWGWICGATTLHERGSWGRH